MSDDRHAEHQECRGEVEAERFWEDRYRRRERVWSRGPNPVLVDVVGGLRPGRALDLGCGEGGDAIWLARQGWRVRAVDVSATTLDRIAEYTASANGGGLWGGARDPSSRDAQTGARGLEAPRRAPT